MHREQKKAGSQDSNRGKWQITVKTNAATLICSYHFAPVVHDIVKNLRRILNPINDEAITFDEVVQKLTQRTLRELIEASLSDALRRSKIEAQKVMLRKLSDDNHHLSREKLRKWIEQAAREARSEARRRMGARMRGGSEALYPLPQLSTRYELLLPMWKDAKRIYRQNATRRNWRNMVKAEYEELPDDLVDKLSLQGEDKPSELAIEHAARLCGVPANYYSIRHLRERLRSQR